MCSNMPAGCIWIFYDVACSKYFDLFNNLLNYCKVVLSGKKEMQWKVKQKMPPFFMRPYE